MQNLSMAHGPHHEPAEDSALGLEMQATEAVLFYSSCYFTHVSFDPGELMTTPMIPARTL